MTHERSPRDPDAVAVVLASGAGTRVGSGMNKVFLPLAGHPVVSWSLGAFAAVPEFGLLVLVIRPQDEEWAAHVLDTDVLAGVDIEVVYGGATRQESEWRALQHLEPRIQGGAARTILLHDAARPLISPVLINRVLDAANKHGAAVPGLPMRDVVAVRDSALEEQPEEELVGVQTPQGFSATPLLAAYERARDEEFEGTDTASCVERFGGLPVRRVSGEQRNFKITYAHDLTVAEHVLRRQDGADESSQSMDSPA